MHIKIASIMLIASVLGLSALAPLTYTQTSIAQQEDLINAIAGGFESISVVQDANQIVITIAKTGGGETPANGTVPTEPIVIIPPNNETGQNGTIITPPLQNQTGNVTLPEEPPVIIIDPDGNNTVVQPPSNVTVIDNGTVIIHPPEQNVTETPGNVTVVDPPVGNVTEPGVPGECGCPIDGDGAIAPDDNVTGVEPAPAPPVDVNQNITVEQPPVAPNQDLPQPEDGGSGDGGGNGNGDGGDGNGGGQ